MRCPDCQKFVGLETNEPEVEDIDIDNEGHISGSIRIVRNCADCSTELKEYNFDIDADVDIEEPDEPKDGEKPHEHELSIEETSCDSTETGGGRYKKNMIGYCLSYNVKCSSCDFETDGSIEDSTPASSFDEMV